MIISTCRLIEFNVMLMLHGSKSFLPQKLFSLDCQSLSLVLINYPFLPFSMWSRCDENADGSIDFQEFLGKLVSRKYIDELKDLLYLQMVIAKVIKSKRELIYEYGTPFTPNVNPVIRRQNYKTVTCQTSGSPLLGQP